MGITLLVPWTRDEMSVVRDSLVLIAKFTPLSPGLGAADP